VLIIGRGFATNSSVLGCPNVMCPFFCSANTLPG
jgi:hypothetical protein